MPAVFGKTILSVPCIPSQCVVQREVKGQLLHRERERASHTCTKHKNTHTINAFTRLQVDAIEIVLSQVPVIFMHAKNLAEMLNYSIREIRYSPKGEKVIFQTFKL